jgi:hypothetical protein
MSQKAVLSKSTFIKGLQCEKSLYLHKKRPYFRDALSDELKAKFTRGISVGEFARDLFPGGINAAPPTHFQMAAAAKKTREYIADGHSIIYEAVFEYQQVIIALDILNKASGWLEGCGSEKQQGDIRHFSLGRRSAIFCFEGECY